MFAKTCTIAFIAIWLVNASLAAPAPEPEPEAQPDPYGYGCGCGHGCSVSQVQAATISSHIPIKTTHKIIGNSGCGCGWDSGYGGGWSNGYGGWDSGYGGWDSGCGGWGDCVITRIHHVPVTSHVPIKTTHRVIPQYDCGCSGWSSLAGYGNGYGCGCGCNGWW